MTSAERQPHPIHRLEERYNVLSHGLGVLLSIAGLVIMLIFAAEQGNALKIVCASIYGASLILLYLASTVYHAMRGRAGERKLRLLDHAAIYVLIAGSYTPYTLIGLQYAWGWTIFGVIWGLALLGVLFKLRFGHKYPRLSTWTYLAMGWLIVVAIVPMIERFPPGIWPWIVAGGLSYSVGVIFFTWEGLKYNHAIWHLFVLGGSICHFFGVLLHLLPL